MSIENMYELICMFKELARKDEIISVEDYIFCADGKTIVVQLSTGNEYSFSV